MTYSIETKREANTNIKETYTNIPDLCPVCNTGIDVRIHFGYYEELRAAEAQVVFQCPRVECRSLFIGYYDILGNKQYSLDRVAPIEIQPRKISNEIVSISESFVTIYNEAFKADCLGLKQICGAGYRKALEFLIKDYVIRQTDDKTTHDQIRGKFLGNVIKDHLPDGNVNSMAEKAAWLGNDETHYVRIWTNMDIEDLKNLIDLTVKWMEMEEMTRVYSEEMSSRDKPQRADAP